MQKKNACLPHISTMNIPREKDRRIDSLSADERSGFRWLFEGYSEPWTTETLGLEKPAARMMYRSIYRKLGVRNARDLIRYYAASEVRIKGRDPPGKPALELQEDARLCRGEKTADENGKGKTTG